MRTLLFALASLASLAVGCDRDHVTASVTSSATATGTGTATGPLSGWVPRWTRFPGPFVQPHVTGARIWALVPDMSGDFGTAELAVANVVRIEGNDVVVRNWSDTGELVSPGVFARDLAPPPSLAKGDVVLFPNTWASNYGHVLSVAGGFVVVRYYLIDHIEERRVPLDEVLKVEDKVAVGAMVREGDGRSGKLLAIGEDKSWLSGSDPFQADTKRLVPFKITKPLAKGDAAFFIGATALPVTIAEVVDGGTAYEVAFSETNKKVYAFSEVGAP